MSKPFVKGGAWSPRRRGLLLAGAFLILAAAVLAGYLLTRPRQIELPYLTARYIAVLDVDSGRLVYEKDVDTPCFPASVTKLMTLSLVLDEIDAGRLSWEDRYQVHRQEAETVGSKVGLHPGDILSVRQLVAGTALVSGCDCVQCLVNMVAGSETAFVDRMNARAEELGLDGTRYANATGVDADGHYMTARDIAVLADRLVKDHPELLEFTSQPQMEVEGRTFRNTNRLTVSDPRVLGLKTGTAELSGYNLVTYSRWEGKDYIIVLLDSNNSTTRFTETETILDALYPQK